MKTTKAPKFGPVHAVPTFTVKIRGEHGCSMLSRYDLVDEQAACYLATRPNGVVDVFYSEHCAHCRGSGRVSKRSRARFASKPCPVCKGSPEIMADTLLEERRNPCDTNP